MDLWFQSVLVAALSEPRSTSRKQSQTESTEVPACHIVTVSPGASGHPQRRQSHTQGQQRGQGGVVATIWIKSLAPVWAPEFDFICFCWSRTPKFSLTRTSSKLAQGCPHPVPIPSSLVPSCPLSLPLLLIPLLTSWVSFPCGMSEIPDHPEPFIPFHSLHTPFPQGHSAEAPLLWG